MFNPDPNFKFYWLGYKKKYIYLSFFVVDTYEVDTYEPIFIFRIRKNLGQSQDSCPWFFYESGSRKILRNRPAAILDWGTLLLVEEQKWSTAKVQPTMLHFPNNSSNQLFLWRKLLPVHEYMYSYQIYFGTTSRSKLVGKNKFLLQLSIVAVLKFYY